MAECRSAGETALHLLAKDIIQQGGAIELPAYRVATEGGMIVAQKSQYISFDRVDIEVPHEGFRPDLIGIIKGKSDPVVHRLIIEIKVTHAVDDDKLKRLEAHGESVVEIDLSALDRGLTGRELKDQLLGKAPRAWLFHRNQDALRAKALKQWEFEKGAQSRKKSMAIDIQARRKEERQHARDRTHKVDDAAVRGSVRTERYRWRFLNMGDLFTRPADDGVFEVGSDVWRSFVLSHLAPWADNPYRLKPGHDVVELSRDISQKLVAKGWVKPEFASPVKEFVGRRYILRNISSEAVEQFLLNGLSAYGFADIRHAKGISLNRAADALAVAWTDGMLWAKQVARVCKALSGHGVDVWLGTEKLSVPVSLNAILVASVDKGPGNWRSVEDIAYEIETGLPRYGVRRDASFYAHEGLSLCLDGQNHKTNTQASLDYIRSHHIRRWRAQLDAWLGEHADRLFSVFLSLDNDLPGLRQAAESCGALLIYDQSTLRLEIERPLIFDEDRPLVAAQTEAGKQIRRLDELSSSLKTLSELCVKCSDPEVSALIVDVGTKSAFQRRHEQSSGNEKLEASALASSNAIAALDRAGQGWGFGDSFSFRALTSVPFTGSGRLIDLMFGDDIVLFRKAMVEITSRRYPPKWVRD
jgi:hypothetical protein